MRAVHPSHADARARDAMPQIQYSEKYYDDENEYRCARSVARDATRVE